MPGVTKLKEANVELEKNRIQGAKEKEDFWRLWSNKTKTKTIKLADFSIAGRRAVDENVKNPMVSDSEDEKRI